MPICQRGATCAGFIRRCRPTACSASGRPCFERAPGRACRSPYRPRLPVGSYISGGRGSGSPFRRRGFRGSSRPHTARAVFRNALYRDGGPKRIRFVQEPNLTSRSSMASSWPATPDQSSFPKASLTGPHSAQRTHFQLQNTGTEWPSTPPRRPRSRCHVSLRATSSGSSSDSSSRRAHQRSCDAGPPLLSPRSSGWSHSSPRWRFSG